MTTDVRPLIERLHAALPAIRAAVEEALRLRHPFAGMDAAAQAHTSELVPLLALAVLDDPSSSAGQLRRAALGIARTGANQTDVLDVVDFALSLIIAQAWRRGRPGDHGGLTDLTRRASAVLATVQRAVVDAYWSQARADRFGRHERRSFAHVLLSGRADEEHARAAGLVLGERYRTVVLRSLENPGRWRAAASEALHRDDVLHCVLAHEIVLFEAEDAPDARLRPGRELGVGLVAAGAAPPQAVADLPVAVASARLVAGLALTVPLLDVVVSAEQLPLELSLLNDENLAATMRSAAEPIRSQPELLHTIKVLYQLDLNRTGTARRLGIARRTLSGRLVRIHELTGLDPTSTRGIQVLHTALTALSMQDTVRPAPGA